MEGQYQRRPSQQAERPRRVRAGRRLATNDWPGRLGWAGLTWLNAIRGLATERAWTEGLDYAERGQTRRLEPFVGGATASVQGRRYRAYEITMRVEPFSHDQWDAIVKTMVKRSLFAARLLTGEVPSTIEEDVFGGLSLGLIPRSLSEVTSTCDCAEDDPWCKHACCAAMLLAEDIDDKPFLLFGLRGMDGDDLLERLHQRRELESRSTGQSASALRQPFPGDEQPALPLELCLDDFWEAPPTLDDFETVPHKPQVNHALLRRLGPSPFQEGRFPLVGLLATCYDTISASALNESDADTSDPSSNGQTPTAPEASSARAPDAEPDADSGPKLSASQRMLQQKLKARAKAKPKAK
jgi:uncharacterized Zn finger protein